MLFETVALDVDDEDAKLGEARVDDEAWAAGGGLYVMVGSLLISPTDARPRDLVGVSSSSARSMS